MTRRCRVPALATLSRNLARLDTPHGLERLWLSPERNGLGAIVWRAFLPLRLAEPAIFLVTEVLSRLRTNLLQPSGSHSKTFHRDGKFTPQSFTQTEVMGRLLFNLECCTVHGSATLEQTSKTFKLSTFAWPTFRGDRNA